MNTPSKLVATAIVTSVVAVGLMMDNPKAPSNLLPLVAENETAVRNYLHGKNCKFIAKIGYGTSTDVVLEPAKGSNCNGSIQVPEEVMKSKFNNLLTDEEAYKNY